MNEETFKTSEQEQDPETNEDFFFFPEYHPTLLQVCSVKLLIRNHSYNMVMNNGMTAKSAQL